MTTRTATTTVGDIRITVSPAQHLDEWRASFVRLPAIEHRLVRGTGADEALAAAVALVKAAA